MGGTRNRRRPSRRPTPARGESRRPPAPSRSHSCYSLSEEETYDLGCKVAQELRAGDVVLLEGELGLGKTVFARGLAAGLGIEPADVSSPSFTLIQEYRGGRIPMYHVDLYRLGSAQELATLGLEDYVTAGGVVVIEWGDKLPESFRRDALIVRLHDCGEGSRRIEVMPEAQSTR